MSRNENRIYVGNLPPDIRTKDIEDLFYKFGKIVFIDLKNRKGPPFAFVEFEDSRLVRGIREYIVLFISSVSLSLLIVVLSFAMIIICKSLYQLKTMLSDYTHYSDLTADFGT